MIIYIVVKLRNGVYGIYGDYFKVLDGNEFLSEEYREYIKEFVVEYSFVKYSYYYGKFFMVGVILCFVNNVDIFYGRVKEFYESYKDFLRFINLFVNNFV